MKRILILAAALALGGCQTNMISADAVDGVATPILNRHNAYVSADPALDEAAKADYLRSAALLRALLDEAKSK